MNFYIASATLALVLLGTGLASNCIPRVADDRNETWMEKRVPKAFNGYTFQGGANPEQSYKMDALTYETLRPYGIVCRVFSDGKSQFDTVVIHSNNADSFHDPRVCFQSQGSDLLNQHVEKVNTGTRGSIPVTFIKTSYNGSNRIAAYTYRGPSGFTAEPIPLLNDMFFSEIKKGTTQTGTFFRFIALNPSSSEADLTKYISQFMDSIYKSSEELL